MHNPGLITRAQGCGSLHHDSLEDMEDRGERCLVVLGGRQSESDGNMKAGSMTMTKKERSQK